MKMGNGSDPDGFAVLGFLVGEEELPPPPVVICVGALVGVELCSSGKLGAIVAKLGKLVGATVGTPLSAVGSYVLNPVGLRDGALEVMFAHMPLSYPQE